MGMDEKPKALLITPDPKVHIKDLPRAEVIEMANNAIQNGKGRTKVYFKFTCQHCGQRCTFADMNVCHVEGECFKCGKMTEVKEAGFMLVLDMPGKPSRGKQ